jgi:hypothetical protein
MYRSNSELRILQRMPTGPLPTISGKDRSKSMPGAKARSLFEASAQRAASHSSSGRHGQPDLDHGGIPDRFLEAYINALQSGNVQWASETKVSSMFADDVRMTGQDRKTIVGKNRVLQRLNQGVEMLIQMAGSNAAVPTWEVKGPTLTEAMFHQYKCTIKRGALRFSFVLEFLIVGGKIKQLRNARS